MSKSEASKSLVDAIDSLLSGLKLSPAYSILYRVARSDENPKDGLVAKDPSAEKSVISHVNCGGRSNYKSQFISTTKSLDVAKRYKAKAEKEGATGLQIVKIDLHALPEGCNLEIVDLTIKENRDKYLKKAVCHNFAKASEEVLLTCDVPIPCDVIEEEKSLKDNMKK